MVDKKTKDFWKGYKRDPELSLAILHTINALMAKYPHLRLGQLLQNCMYEVDEGPDSYYIEDEKLLEGMNKFLDRFDEDPEDK